MKIKPLGDRVIINPTEAEKTTKSGLFIPDTAQQKPLTGKVEAAGENLTVKEGDIVMYGKNSGIKVQVYEKEYLIMRESEIMAILNV